MPRYEWQVTRTGGRRYVRIENGPIARATPKGVTVEVPQAAMVIEPPDPPVAAPVDLAPTVKPVVSDAEIKVPKPRKPKSDG